MASLESASHLPVEHGVASLAMSFPFAWWTSYEVLGKALPNYLLDIVWHPAWILTFHAFSCGAKFKNWVFLSSLATLWNCSQKGTTLHQQYYWLPWQGKSYTDRQKHWPISQGTISIIDNACTCTTNTFISCQYKKTPWQTVKQKQNINCIQKIISSKIKTNQQHLNKKYSNTQPRHPVTHPVTVRKKSPRALEVRCAPEAVVSLVNQSVGVYLFVQKWAISMVSE